MIGVLLAAILDVRGQSLRTIAVVLGLATAIASVVLIDSSFILSMQANDEYTATTFGRSATFRVAPATDSTDISGADLEFAEQSLQVVFSSLGAHRFSRDAKVPITIITDKSWLNANAHWVSSTYQYVGLVSLRYGTFPSRTAQAPTLHVVVSEAFLMRQGISPETAMGQSLEYVEGTSFNGDIKRTLTRSMIIDAVAKQLGPTQDSLDILIVSDNSALPGLDAKGLSWLVAAKPNDSVSLDRLVSYGVATDGQTPVFRVSRVDIGDSVIPLLRQQQLTGRIASAIVLIVAGLGLLGIGLASTRERAREYGLRRAIGVSRVKVFLGVVTQTCIEASIAGLAGLACAFVLVNLFSRNLVLAQLPMPSRTGLPLESGIKGILAALAIGLLAALLPALRASQLSVAQSLRD